MLEKIETSQSTRRGFLGSMTALTAASYNRVLGANDRVGIGFIGYGLIGKQHITNFKKSFPDVDRVAMCDVYKPRLDEGLAYLENPNAKGYGDFRKMYENKDIDGVVVATPDHWHAMLTIMACAAGKDVYVEKPLTVFIDEGKWMLQAMNKYKRVVVVGTQRNHNPGHQVAKKIIESGVLGKIQMVRLGNGGRNVYPGFGKTPVENPPADFDYDMWLGPAPKKPYQNHRGLYHFRWFWDYSGGQLTNNRGPHHRGVSVGHGRERTHQGGVVRRPLHPGGRWRNPRHSGRHLPVPGVHDDRGRAGSQRLPRFGRARGHGQQGQPAPGQQPGGSRNRTAIPSTRFRGSWAIRPAVRCTPTRLPCRGLRPSRDRAARCRRRPRTWRTRGGGAAAPVAEPWLAASRMEDQMFNANKRDWVNCIKSRNKPFCDLEGGHRTAIICNLGNISLRLGGRTVQWDPEKEVVVGDKEAAAMCVRPYRAPWDGVLKSIVKV